MKVNFIVAFLLLSSFLNAQEISLQNAIPSDFGKTTRTAEQRFASKSITDIVKGKTTLDSLSLAYTNMGQGDIWFRLFDDLSIHAVNIGSKQYIGGWSLKANDPCEDAGNSDCEKPWWAGRWNSTEPLEPQVIELFSQYEGGSLTAGLSNLGCYGDHPLRFGDIEGDGKKELIAIVSDNWIVFNTDKKAVTFLSLLNVDDWRTAEETLEQLGTENNVNNPQYVSKMAFSAAFESKIDEQIKVPGYRGYAKLYVGHFLDSASNDIVVWRKLYQARLNKDSIKGFEKKSDIFLHYKLINGEYKKQPTESSVVKGWLTAKNLTWKKGYPSKSECAGQEGQFIPEMHDPLLNDPDVLQ